MFKKVGAVVLFVNDFEKTLAFYRDTMGLKAGIVEENFAAFEMDGHNFALQGNKKAVDLFDVKVDAGAKDDADRVMLCAEVEDVDAAYEMFKAKGVEIVTPPVDQFWGIRATYIRDPEGNMWELYQPSASA